MFKSERRIEMAKPVEINELSYEAGVERILQMVEQKLSDAELVVVGIIGATAHVGKTYLAKDLYGRLYELGVPVVSYKSDESPQTSNQQLFFWIEKKVIVVSKVEW